MEPSHRKTTENSEYRHFELTRAPGAVVISLRGRRMLDRERFPYEELNAELIRLLEVEPAGGFVLDYGQVEAIDTLAVQALVGLWKRLKSRGDRLALCGLSGIPLQIMRLVRFDLLFEFYDSPADAIAALNQPDS
jgi:anti-anti-sigma regulatory factor